MDFEKQIEKLKDNINKLDEAYDLLDCARDIIYEESAYIDLVADIEAVMNELEYRIKTQEIILGEVRELNDNISI